MRYNRTHVTLPKEILYNDHYVAKPYNCEGITANADGIIPAGTIVPANDATAIGVLLHDVKPADNPNGTIVIQGYINVDKIPEAPADTVNIPMVQFMKIQ